MKITLESAEIHEALVDYVSDMVTVADGKKVSVVLNDNMTVDVLIVDAAAGEVVELTRGQKAAATRKANREAAEKAAAAEPEVVVEIEPVVEEDPTPEPSEPASGEPAGEEAAPNTEEVSLFGPQSD